MSGIGWRAALFTRPLRREYSGHGVGFEWTSAKGIHWKQSRAVVVDCAGLAATFGST